VVVTLIMVPLRGVPVAVHVSERHRRGSERGCDEDSKRLLENVFHGIRVAVREYQTRSAMQCLKPLRCAGILTQ
jgi:hypothetical protein